MQEPVIELAVHLAFDDEAGVWYVAESDVPGLRLDDTDPHELMRRVDECVPEMIGLNLQEIWRKHLGDFADKHTQERSRFAMKPIFDSPFTYAHA